MQEETKSGALASRRLLSSVHVHSPGWLLCQQMPQRARHSAVLMKRRRPSHHHLHRRPCGPVTINQSDFVQCPQGTFSDECEPWGFKGRKHPLGKHNVKRLMVTGKWAELSQTEMLHVLLLKASSYQWGHRKTFVPQQSQKNFNHPVVMQGVEQSLEQTRGTARNS